MSCYMAYEQNRTCLTCYITCFMVCYITHVMLCYIKRVMSCYIT